MPGSSPAGTGKPCADSNRFGRLFTRSWPIVLSGIASPIKYQRMVLTIVLTVSRHLQPARLIGQRAKAHTLSVLPVLITLSRPGAERALPANVFPGTHRDAITHQLDRNPTPRLANSSSLDFSIPDPDVSSWTIHRIRPSTCVHCGPLVTGFPARPCF